MDALTFWQPWATLAALGIKTKETRSWRPPDRLLGQRIALHAGKHAPPLREFEGTAVADAMEKLLGPDWYAEMPRGAVVATAIVSGYGRTGHGSGVWDPYGDYSPGRYFWLLRDVELVHPPVECRGYQGLWTLDDALREAVALATWEPAC